MRGPSIAANPHNPRVAQTAKGRGEIVASDGTILAISRGGVRRYPLGALAAPVVGYDSERYGTAGLEASFDRVLTARPADAGPLAQLTSILDGGGKPAAHGARIVTTLVPALQRTLYDDLARYRRGAGIALDPRTGAVLAMVSVPSFDPTTLDARWSALAADPNAPLLNRATQGLYPPGSTFKIVTASDALSAGVVTPQTTFEDRGVLQVGNATIHDDESEATGVQNLAGAFALSSNVDFAQIALKIGPARWEADAKTWGLGEPVDFDLPVARDRVPPLAALYPGVLAQLGFGQADLLVTPMRMALVAATIARGGTMPRPYLVRSIAGSDTSVATQPETIATPIDAKTAGEVRALMIAVVQHGTGTPAQIPGVTVAGKTGTATNPHGPAHAWFVAFAPAEAPRVCVAVIVENVGYGAQYAAPIARDVLRVALARSRT